MLRAVVTAGAGDGGARLWEAFRQGFLEEALLRRVPRSGRQQDKGMEGQASRHVAAQRRGSDWASKLLHRRDRWPT